MNSAWSATTSYKRALPSNRTDILLETARNHHNQDPCEQRDNLPANISTFTDVSMGCYSRGEEPDPSLGETNLTMVAPSVNPHC